uniref:Regulatory protein zeste n=1 Tax=Diabrotica virgifera virgifera TaxID=50390 RepID=A0A6P7GML2_DIAVI
METPAVKPRRTTNASDEQKRLLMEFIKKNPILLIAKFSNSFTQKDAQSQWNQIANVLNSCGDGANKDWKPWRKTWQDIRSRTKVKSVQYKKHAQGTGGGPPIKEEKPFEKEVMETITVISLAGQPNIAESATNFDVQELEVDNLLSNDQQNVVHEEQLEQQSEVKTITLMKPECSQNASLSQVDPAEEPPFLEWLNENYQKSLKEKNAIKKNYYEKKIKLLERLALAKERSADAKELEAAALQYISAKLDEFF